MLDINSLEAGRRYSFIHNSEIETVAERDGKLAPDWLNRAVVTRRAVFSGNAVSEESYSNMRQRELNDEAQRQSEVTGRKICAKQYVSSGRSWWKHHPEQNGIVLHKTSEKPYLCVLYPRTQSAKYFVNGIEATDIQIATIREFKKSTHVSKCAVFDLEKVQCQGYIEEFEDTDIED